MNDEYGNLGNYGEYEIGGETRAIRANLPDLNKVVNSRDEAIDSLALIPFQDSWLLIVLPLIDGDIDLDINEAVIMEEDVDSPIVASQGNLILFGFNVQKCPPLIMGTTQGFNVADIGTISVLGGKQNSLSNASKGQRGEEQQFFEHYHQTPSNATDHLWGANNVNVGAQLELNLGSDPFNLMLTIE